MARSEQRQELNGRETELLGKSLEFFEARIESTGRAPNVDDLRSHLKCSQHCAMHIAAYIKQRLIPALMLKARDSANKARHARLTAHAAIDVMTQDRMHLDEQEYLTRELARTTRGLEKARMDANVARKVAREVSRRSTLAEDEIITELKKIAGEFQGVVPVTPHQAEIESPVDKNHTEDVVCPESDHHFGARTRDEDVSGFPEFNCNIAAARMGYISMHQCRIIRCHRAMYPLNDLYWPILGDVGNGELHDAPMTNELFPPAQIYFGWKMLDLKMQNFLSLRPHVLGGSIKVITSVGNHMRTSDKMPLAFQAQRTLDWVIYKMLYEKYKSVSGVQFIEDESPFVFTNIRGHRYCFTHGTQASYENNADRQVRGLSEFVARVRAIFDSPIFRKRRARKERDALHLKLSADLGRACDETGSTFDRMVIGNIHVPISMPRILTNGCLPGQNELGVNWLLEPIPAGQWMFGVSNKHQKTWEYFIDSTEVQNEDSGEFTAFSREFVKRYGR